LLKEEWRLHQSLIGPYGSSLYPAFIFILSAGMAMMATLLLKNIDLFTILLLLHSASALYGLFVGSLGHIGEEVLNRRLGTLNMLLQLPQILPVSFKRIMAMFYLKDALYYLFYTYVPLTAGIAVATPLAGVSLRSVFLLGVSMFLTFMMGMGLSFMLSAISIKSKETTIFLCLLILGLISLVWPFRVLQPSYLLLPLGFWTIKNGFYLVTSAIVALILSSLAIHTVEERPKTPHGRYKSILIPVESKFLVAGEFKTLLAKEWLELIRSGALAQVMAGFLGLISGVYFVVWLIEVGIGFPLPFNLVSYSGFVGLMGVMTYSWITSVESNESLSTIPVTVDQVVKAKIILNLLLTTSISTGFIILLAIARNEIVLIPIGLLVAGTSMIYLLVVTAHLTGLWTNTMFFDAKVLTKFTIAVAPPLASIELFSLFMEAYSFLAVCALVIVSIFQLFLTVPIFSKLRNKWKNGVFSYVPGS
jgi:hypothetical protein